MNKANTLVRINIKQCVVALLTFDPAVKTMQALMAKRVVRVGDGNNGGRT
ncbi:MAG: hypothetical protein RRZ73_05420 [Oscillospiraceae bacterium]